MRYRITPLETQPPFWQQVMIVSRIEAAFVVISFFALGVIVGVGLP